MKSYHFIWYDESRQWVAEDTKEETMQQTEQNLVKKKQSWG